VIGYFEMPKINGKFCKPPSTVVLEFRTCLPTPGVGFLFNPPPGIQPQPSNAAEMEAPLNASCPVKSERIGMLNYTIQNGPALPQSHRPCLETLCK